MTNTKGRPKHSHKDWEIEIATCIILMGKLAMSNLMIGHYEGDEPVSTSKREMAAETMALLQKRLSDLLLIDDDIILEANIRIDSGMSEFQEHIALPN